MHIASSVPPLTAPNPRRLTTATCPCRSPPSSTSVIWFAGCRLPRRTIALSLEGPTLCRPEVRRRRRQGLMKCTTISTCRGSRPTSRISCPAMPSPTSGTAAHTIPCKQTARGGSPASERRRESHGVGIESRMHAPRSSEPCHHALQYCTALQVEGGVRVDTPARGCSLQ